MKLLAFLLLTILTAGTASPQESYSIQQWTAREGLPQITVNAIEQTEDRFLWIGTFGGLCRFDGRDFVPFSMADHPALGSNRILALESTADGRLWIGMENGGLAVYDGQEIRRVPAIPRSASVTQLVEDSLGVLWACTLKRIWIVGPHAPKLLVNDLEASAVLTEASPGRMLCGHVGFELIDAEGRREPAYEAVETRVNEAVIVGNDLWYVDLLGLNRLPDGGQPTVVQEYDTTVSSSLFVDSQERLWASTSKGVVFWDGAQLRDPLMGLGPPVHGYAMSQQLFEDSEGSLWLGGPSGLSCLRPSPVSASRPPVGRPVSVSQVAHLGERIVAIHPLGESLHTDGTFQELGRTIGLFGPAAGDDLWTADLANRLGRWNGKTFTPLALPALPSKPACWIESSNGDHWLAGEFGLARLRNDNLRFWSEADGMAPGPGRSLLETRDGALWVGSSGGLSRFDGKRFQRWLGGTDLPQGAVRALLEDDGGALWIGTYGGGFARWLDGEISPVRFPDMHVSTLVREAPDSDDVLVLGNRALWRTQLSKMNRVAEGHENLLLPERFDEGPGIADLEAEGMRGPSHTVDGEGIHWFSTIEGLLRYDPQERTQAPPPPPAYVTAVELEGQVHRGDHPLRFGPERRNPIFHFTAPAFAAKDTVEFWYRLAGHEEDWHQSRGERHAIYSSLPPGNYVFEVRARRGAAAFGPVGRSAPLVALPFWYENLAFRSAVALLGLILIGTYVRNRIRTEAVRAERLELEVAARTRDLLEVQANLEDKVQQRTQQLEADLQRREALARELEQAKRFHTIGRLAGGVAHDFNNTLAVISCESHVLLSNLDRQRIAPERARDSLERVQRATVHAAKLTRQLLAYSGKQMVKAQALDPNTIVRELEILLRRLIRSSIELQVRLEPDVGSIYMDPGQFEQVVMNLVLNARDAIEGNGTIVLSTRSVAPDSEQASGRWIELTVEDDGRGIHQEDVGQIFEPFFTTRRSQGGTGLGLASVEGIVHHAQGSIDVHSTPGDGSTFRVRFPAHMDPLPDAAAPGAAPAEQSRPAHIVVCEDQETLGKAVRLLLVEQGHEVTLYHHPHDALRGLERDASVDLLLTDVVMPDMDGLELFHQAQARRPNLRVLFTTGYALNPDVSRVLSQGEYPLLQKPYHPDRLFQEIQRVLQESVLAIEVPKGSTITS